jgi:hypothetical protein
MRTSPPSDPIRKEQSMSKDKQRREAKKPKKSKLSKPATPTASPRPLVTPIAPSEK